MKISPTICYIKLIFITNTNTSPFKRIRGHFVRISFYLITSNYSLRLTIVYKIGRVVVRHIRKLIKKPRLLNLGRNNWQDYQHCTLRRHDRQRCRNKKPVLPFLYRQSTRWAQLATLRLFGVLRYSKSTSKLSIIFYSKCSMQISVLIHN